MQPTIHFEQDSPYLSSIRAEDGKQPSQWSVLCEGVLIPFGSLIIIFLCMLLVMAN